MKNLLSILFLSLVFFTIPVLFFDGTIIAEVQDTIVKDTQNDSFNKNDLAYIVDTSAIIDSRLDTIAFLIAHRETGGTFNPKIKSACGTYCGLLQMDSWWVDKANTYNDMSVYTNVEKYVSKDRFNPIKCIEIWKIHQYERNKKIGLEYSIIDALVMAVNLHAGGNAKEKTINYYKCLYKKLKNGEIEFIKLQELEDK